jgi:hypothetical protein
VRLRVGARTPACARDGLTAGDWCTERASQHFPVHSWRCGVASPGMSWELPPWVEPTRYQEIDPDEVQKGDIIGTADVNHSPFVVDEVD